MAAVGYKLVISYLKYITKGRVNIVSVLAEYMYQEDFKNKSKQIYRVESDR